MRMLVALLGAALMTVPVEAQQPSVPGAMAVDAATARTIAERTAALLETRYVAPATGARYAAALRAHASRGDYAGYTARDALVARLTADLQAVAPDGHLHFYPEEQPAPSPAPRTAAAAGPIAAHEGERSIAPGIRAMRWVAPGVAYLSFEHFDDRPEALTVLRRFFADYGSARALIIDSRDNGGGAFDMLGVLANHLFAKPRLLANMDMATSVVTQFGTPFPVDGAVLKKVAGPPHMTRFEHHVVPAPDAGRWPQVPVYYLTSRHTFSAAEHLAMVLKSTGRATLIGETTGGGNHFGGTEPVGGGLELYVPIGRTTDPATGRDWEAVGIVPDVPIPADEALDEALRRTAAHG